MDLLKYLGGNKKHIPTVLVILQIFNLSVVFAMIYFGWNMLSEDLRYTNFASFFAFVVWWPMIIFFVLFAGRLWCAMCHLKVIANFFDRFGLQIKVPKWLTKYGTTITLIMPLGVFLLHSNVASYGVNHFAYMTAIYLIILIAYAVAVALIFERNAFCKSFCPLVAFLGPYTRCSPTELRSDDPQKCRECKAKECIKHCRNKLYIGTMDSQQQEGCLLCMECVKHCPNDNITFRLRRFFKGIWDSPKRSAAGTLAVIVLLGIVIGEVGEEWVVVDEAILFVPGIISGLTGFETIFDAETGGYLLWESLWMFGIQPAIIIGICGILAMLLARKESAWNYIKIYALGFVPMLLSLHIAKHFHTVQSKISYIPHVITDPFGTGTAEAIKTGVLTKPGAFLPCSIEGYLLMLFIALFGIGGALYATWKISKMNFEDDPKQGLLSAIPFLLMIAFLGIVFVLTIYNWIVIVA